jgi:TldD protein
VIIAALALAAALPAGAVDPLEAAMAWELRRAKVELKQEGYPGAYYVGLSAIDVDSWEQRLEMGSPYFTGRYTQRLVLPTVRAGSHALDNHPTSNITGFQARSVSAEDDEFALRYGLWRQLDGAYKTASAEFLRKQAVRVSRGKTEYDTDDLTQEQPRRREAKRPASPWDTAALSRLAVLAGRTLRREPGLLSADSSVRLRRQWTRLRDSDGSVVDFGRDSAEIEVEASTNSADGTRLYSSRRYTATTPQALPAPATVRSDTEEMLADLRALTVAKTTSPFSAPTLIDPSGASAAVLAVGLRLSGEEQRNPAGAQTFRGKIGKPVLPAGFSLVDDPTITVYKGKALVGHYEFDDQGIPAQKVTLIDDGVLKGMLLSRYPVVGMPKSNGHGRAFPGYAPEGLPGSLFLTSTAPLSRERLLERLREECRKRGKPYGIWIRKIRGFSQQQGTSGHASIRFSGALTYLVDANTGTLTLVRDLDLVGTPLALLGNVLAAGDDAQARDMVYGAPISVVAPSLLLAEGELQRSESRPERPPILPAPPVKKR